MGARERRSTSVITSRPPVMLFHEDFVSAAFISLYGTRPDTYNAAGVTDTWHDIGQSPAVNLYKYDTYGGAFCSSNSTHKGARINCTKTDVQMEGTWYFSSDDAYSYIGLMARITDVTDNGFVTDCVRCEMDPWNNRVRLFEVVGGVNVQTVTLNVAIPVGTHTIKMYCFGNQAAVMFNGTKSAVMTLTTRLNGTNVGFVTYRPSGIYVVMTNCKAYEIFDKGWP